MQNYLNESYAWPAIRRVIGMFIPQRYRRCKLCEAAFADGILFIDKGYLSDGVCSACYQKACSGELHPDLVLDIVNAFEA